MDISDENLKVPIYLDNVFFEGELKSKLKYEQEKCALHKGKAAHLLEN